MDFDQVTLDTATLQPDSFYTQLLQAQPLQRVLTPAAAWTLLTTQPVQTSLSAFPGCAPDVLCLLREVHRRLCRISFACCQLLTQCYTSSRRQKSYQKLYLLSTTLQPSSAG